MPGWPGVFLAREDDSDSHIDCIGPISKNATLWIYRGGRFQPAWQFGGIELPHLAASRSWLPHRDFGRRRTTWLASFRKVFVDKQLDLRKAKVSPSLDAT
jgi:hypothetical protein